ncbi:Uncharacterized protein MLTONO_2178 [Mesorhizobium loti]|nr:Uncharacterized protein MLTONO_2178 [Mesorhizobium loti]
MGEGEAIALNDDLETLQRETFDYFVHEANPANGLIRDKTEAIGPQASPPLRWEAMQ